MKCQHHKEQDYANIAHCRDNIIQSRGVCPALLNHNITGLHAYVNSIVQSISTSLLCSLKLLILPLFTRTLFNTDLARKYCVFLYYFFYIAVLDYTARCFAGLTVLSLPSKGIHDDHKNNCIDKLNERRPTYYDIILPAYS